MTIYYELFQIWLDAFFIVVLTENSFFTAILVLCLQSVSYNSIRLIFIFCALHIHLLNVSGLLTLRRKEKEFLQVHRLLVIYRSTVSLETGKWRAPSFRMHEMRENINDLLKLIAEVS